MANETKIEQRTVTLPGIEATLPVEIVTEDGIGLIKHDVLENFVKKQPRIKATYRNVFHNLAPFCCVVECTMVDSETGYEVTKVGETNVDTLNSPISKKYPFTMAYQRAYNRAAIAILGLSEDGKTYSDVEISKYELQQDKKKPSKSSKAPAAPAAPQKEEEKPAEEIQESPADVIPEDIPSMDVQTSPQETQQEDAPKDEPKAEVMEMTDDTVILIGGSAGMTYGEAKETQKFKAYVKWCKKQSSVSFQKPEQKAQFDFFRSLPD